MSVGCMPRRYMLTLAFTGPCYRAGADVRFGCRSLRSHAINGCYQLLRLSNLASQRRKYLDHDACSKLQSTLWCIVIADWSSACISGSLCLCGIR
jgi:hypothetical protein